MLEYLYDLLDAADRQAMQDHLAACAACRTALAKAEHHRKCWRPRGMEFPSADFDRRRGEALPALSR